MTGFHHHRYGFEKGLLVLLGGVLVAAAGFSQNVEQPKNALGWADKGGHLSIWFDFDDDLNFGGPDASAQLPMRLHYSSVPRFAAPGIGGEGWWLPLLESRVVKTNEGAVKLHTLAGGTETLLPDSKAAGLYATRDQQWRARVKSGHFEVTDGAGWTYDYADGRLLAAQTHTQDVLRWSYTGTQVTAIESKQFGRLLSVFYDPKNGLVSRVDYNKKDSISLKTDARLQVSNAADGTAIISTANSICGMDNKAGYHLECVWERDPQSRWMKLTTTEKDGAKAQHSSTFQYDPATGWLKHDGSFAYTVTPGSGGDGLPLLERENARGQKESYHYDARKMEAVQTKLDGSTLTHQYVNTPGPAFGKLMKTVQRLRDGTVNVTYEATFDAAGNVSKLNTGGSNIKTLTVTSWDPAEAVPLIAQFQTPDKEDLNIAGPKNLLVGAVIGGRPFVYLHDDQGRMTNRLHLSEFLKQNRAIKLPVNTPAWLVAALKDPSRGANVNAKGAGKGGRSEGVE